jgi:hypothetical protein
MTSAEFQGTGQGNVRTAEWRDRSAVTRNQPDLLSLLASATNPTKPTHARWLEAWILPLTGPTSPGDRDREGIE